ncbi:MAG TPA: YitT family protein [Actinomycetales bacterium]|nr:YitT family protein [Actinomycetales bacterium]
MHQQPGHPERPDVGNVVRRALVLLFGLFVMAIGIALTTRAHLGTSPISAPPYVVSLWGTWTFGQYTYAMLVGLVVFQILLLRRRYEPVQLLQLVSGLAFSFFVDVGMWITPMFDPATYPLQLGQTLLGSVVLGIGVALQVAPRLTYLPGDGTVVALTKVLPIEFSRMKIIFDSTLVATAVVFALVVWGELRGVREGTIVAAVLVGVVVGRVMPTVRRVMGRIRALPPGA